MASTQAKRLYRVIRETRRGAQNLAKFGASLHGSRGITPAEREVLELLVESGSRTVPAIARARGCSRQHIQARVDALRARGLLQPVCNPAHQKSSLIALTDRGRDLFTAMSRREEEFFEAVVGRFSAEELAAAARTLATLNAVLDESISAVRD